MPITADMTDITNHIRRLSTPFRFCRSPSRSLYSSFLFLRLPPSCSTHRNCSPRRKSLNAFGHQAYRRQSLRSLAPRPSPNRPRIYALSPSACDAFICLNASLAETIFWRVPFWGENRFAFMNDLSLRFSRARWLAAVVAAGIWALHVSNAAESPPVNTNAPSIALDGLVADVLEHNPELGFYRAEIAAAKGERPAAVA